MISQRTLCFLHRGRQVLLLHRRRSPNAGMWNGIGGKIEPGETPFAACVREVREETGLTIPSPDLRGLLVVTVQATGDVWIIYVFTAPAPDGPLAPSPEGDLRWVDAEQIASLHTPADLPVILPRILNEDGITVVRIHYATDDAVEPQRLEILGP
ncbi:MAG: 8-oxo-dGTP diphosphatase [Armatimonadota bacterium]|nr:8-oxo-dGTP diphosphatase [Armatimonadota bacterium]MDR7451026.1 8-oxo-dGTP diphosphatase [Armatimonadota bacterium]MDR7465953.1 8-oxo-dGTP diphosphatase [Armatimonadota bacterium]MDR7494018.1 8-oxo-dGTP diphosphatase [Armatimonadota bacterium]MDR7498468.1 8-oxo-dGTP diphosphatase [Armatimonadota bacterium]